MTISKSMTGALLGVCLAGAIATPSAHAENSQATFAYSPAGEQELVLNGGATVLNAISTGWYDQTGYHDSANPNYIAGLCGSSDACDGGDLIYNDFFVFDLSAVTGPIVSAALSLGQPAPNGYFGPAGGSTYTNYDVATPISQLTADQSGATAIFNDLGSGTAYGSTVVGLSSVGAQVDIAINANGLAALNSAEGGQFAIGGAVTTIPELSTWGMMLVGFLGLGFAGYRSPHKPTDHRQHA